MATPSTGSAKLYTPRLLGLSAALADYPLIDSLPLRAQLRSRSCGSVIDLALDTDAAGAISRIGMQVSACAVGQSSAAILAGEIAGNSVDEISAMLTGIEAWLDGDKPPPQWPQFEALEPARDYPGRHEALLLPWRAALKALSTPDISG